MPLIPTPAPPYYAVIFTAAPRSLEDVAEAERLVRKVFDAAVASEGCLGGQLTTGSVIVSNTYWSDHDAIRRWKTASTGPDIAETGHRLLQGIKTRICKVEMEYGD